MVEAMQNDPVRGTKEKLTLPVILRKFRTLIRILFNLLLTPVLFSEGAAAQRPEGPEGSALILRGADAQRDEGLADRPSGGMAGSVVRLRGALSLWRTSKSTSFGREDTV